MEIEVPLAARWNAEPLPGLRQRHVAWLRGFGLLADDDDGRRYLRHSMAELSLKSFVEATSVRLDVAYAARVPVERWPGSRCRSAGPLLECWCGVWWREGEVGLLESFSAVVRVERHLFALVDTDGEGVTFSRFPEAAAFLAHEGCVVLASDLEDQRARVRVEVWNSLPDAPSEEDFTSLGEQSSVSFESERIQLVSLMGEPQSQEHELAGPGPYQVRVWVGGQQEDLAEELDTYRFFERFVIQLWA
ncbi:hypothetical protein [Streptomyces sp. MMG1121]|uniref:hypothetical protein n=1 Tax=Streptomyces sp. MMG1121 TaxID=1415544 RepID=UPI00131D2B37|nr:hypothetical protein [Streptomyces sp. MMG1121]